MATESSVPPGALAFSRGVYASTMDWYKVADSKGQLLLALNGVYITALSSVTTASSQRLVQIHASLPLATLFLLAGAALATAISILMAIACLYSRLSDATLNELRKSFTEQDAQGGIRYRPAALYWFGTIARADRDIGLKMVQSADEAFELSAVTEDRLSTVSILGMAAATGHHLRIRSGWLTRIPIKKTTKSPSMSAVKRPRWTSAATPSRAMSPPGQHGPGAPAPATGRSGSSSRGLTTAGHQPVPAVRPGDPP